MVYGRLSETIRNNRRNNLWSRICCTCNNRNFVVQYYSLCTGLMLVNWWTKLESSFRYFVIINLLSQIRSFCVNAKVGKNFKWKFLLFRFYFFFKFINFHGQHRLNNVRFVPSVWNRVKYSSWLREKNC